MTVKQIVLGLCSLMVASVCWGQVVWTSTYASNVTYAEADNTSNITNPAFNAWHNTNAALIHVATGADGTIRGLDAQGCMWAFPSDYPVHIAWVKDNTSCNYQLKGLAIIDASHIYGMQGIQSLGCSGNFYPYVRRDPSSGLWFAWGSAQNACLYKGTQTGATISASSDGMICGLATNMYPACMNALNGAGNYFQPIAGVPSGGGGGGYLDAAVRDTGRIYLTSAYWQGWCNLTGTVASLTCTWGQFPHLSQNGSTYQVATNKDDAVWAVGATVSGGNVYRFNWVTNTWQEIYGLIANSISPGGNLNNFATTASGASYRIAMQTIAATATLTGHTICNGGCPNGSQHTPIVSAVFNSHNVGGGTIDCPAVSPVTEVNCSIGTAITDPFFCMEGGTECDLTGIASIQCSVMGAIFSGALGGPLNPANWKHVQTRVDDGTPGGCFNTSTLVCGSKPGCIYKQPFNYYCNGHTVTDHPDYTFTGYTLCNTDGQNPPNPNPNIWGIQAGGLCYYPVPGGSPGFCMHDPLPGFIGNGPLDKDPLYTYKVPVGTKGICTFQGSTN